MKETQYTFRVTETGKHMQVHLLKDNKTIHTLSTPKDQIDANDNTVQFGITLVPDNFNGDQAQWKQESKISMAIHAEGMNDQGMTLQFEEYVDGVFDFTLIFPQPVLNYES